jgi:hypothetical protein
MKKLPLLILLSFFSTAILAQNNFLLYSFKGNVTVVENKVESKAKVGKPLNSAATVKVPAGSMVTLICNEAAMFTLAKAGTYQLAKLGDSCKAVGNSVSSNYVKYVWNQMTATGSSSGSDRKKYMSTVGAVSRDLRNIWIDPKLDTVNYTEGEFWLSWKCYNPDTKEFDFYVYPHDNITSPLVKMTVDKLKVAVHSFTAKLKPGNSYFWTASEKGAEDEDVAMKVLNYVPKETYDAFLKTLKAQAGAFEAPAEEAYRLGFMLEDARYLAEAYSYYTKAATLDPKNVLYRATLMSFKKDYEIK